MKSSRFIPQITRLSSAIAWASILFWHTISAVGSDNRTDTVSTTPRKSVVYQNGVVASDHPLASAAGVEILRKGGNVIDAAVAASFALSVVRPSSCGLGGGGFMLIWNARTQRAVALDYRERAPLKASRNMFLDAAKTGRHGDAPSRTGHLAVAVPGTVAGLCFALKEYGTLDLKTVLEPALRIARQGFLVDNHDREVQAKVLKEFTDHPHDRKRFEILFRTYLNNGVIWRDGDCFVSPQARVLEIIAQHGSDGFYRGRVAAAIVSEIHRNGGVLDAEDLALTKPVVRAPLEGEMNGCKVVVMPPPSSGGVALIESLNILKAWEKTHPNHLGTKTLDVAETLHVLAEILKHAFADRAAHLGDADFVKVPVEHLTSIEYATRIALRIDAQRTKPLAEYGSVAARDDAGTSHFSIIDREGNAVACTETINLPFGSLVVEPQFGIVLNNELDDFAAEPGKPNAFGLVQSEANAVFPNKKPLSSMCPTIVVREGKAVHALGASGGPRIISGTLQVLLSLMRDQLRPDEAVARPRFHHQWLPDFLEVDEPLLNSVRGPLKQRGHRVKKMEGASAVQAVSRTAEGLTGGSDPRKGGRPAGF